MSKKHTYRTATTWTGNLGEGTSSYTAYLRNFTVSAEGKPDLHGSADPAFRGDAGRRKRPRQGFGTAPRSAPPVFHRQLGQLSD